MMYTDDGLKKDFKISVQLLTQVVHNKTLRDHNKKKCISPTMGLLLKTNTAVI